MNEPATASVQEVSPCGAGRWASAMTWTFVLAVPLSLAGLAGCAVGPNYVPSKAPVPAGWVGPTTLPAAGAESADLSQWWTGFDDPTLTSLVQRAVASNLDLKLAEARVRQARASRWIAISGIGPTLGATGSYTRSQSTAPKSRPPISNQYVTGFDAGWEIDIFGGTRRNIEAATADLQAAVETGRDVLVTLAAEVAVDYVDLRTSQQRLAIAQSNLAAQKHSADLTRQRFNGGFVSGLDVANADALVASTAAQVPLLESQAQQAMYSLSVLLDEPPGATVSELENPSAAALKPPVVPVGVPSDLLRRRPDIRAAEAGIHAATARIGVATADLFPKFSLTGDIGVSSA